MRNARKEFLDDTKEFKVICAIIKIDRDNYGQGGTEYILKKGYSESDFEFFLKCIDKDYNEGYGGQELFGTIWCEDGIWLSRGEYDGSEWWDMHKYPEIDKRCFE